MQRRDLFRVFTTGLAAIGLGGLVQGADERPRRRFPRLWGSVRHYTNDEFYKDGVFQKSVARQAMFEMFDRFNYSLAPILPEHPDFWVEDFGIGDFERCGMGGIFWLNNKEYRYFGHEIYLLPFQMIPEHYHVAAEDLPAKHETWQVRHGSIFNFSFGGEQTPEVTAMLPKSQLDAGAINCFNYKEMFLGDMDALAELEQKHFMMAGPEGAIVTEYACYHSPDGLRLTWNDLKKSA